MSGINRRTLVTGLGAAGLTLGLSRGTAFALHGGQSAESSQVARDCIKACTDCHNVCVGAVQHCLNVGGDHVKASHLRLLQTCGELCTVAADFMLSRSEFDKELCAVCEELCKKCADSCAEFKGDQAMQDCADVCRKCADACKKFTES